MRQKIINRLINQLASASDDFELIISQFPADKIAWKPKSWEGVPSEEFSALGQICHLCDIEIDGYQVRFRRTVAEENPFLSSIDGYKLEQERQYHLQEIETVLSKFRAARSETVEMLKSFCETDFTRIADFEGYGTVTLSSLIYFLRSHDAQHLSGMNWLLAKIEAN